MLNRVLRIVNILIALAILAAAGALYWYGWRPLPDTSGVAAMPVSAPASIARDSLGVPHIRAATIEDALFLQGYATAQDRMWQMDGLRRLAAGELAEVVGPGALENDTEARRLRLRRIAGRHARALKLEDRKALAAYARGVNHYLETHHNRLPVEFKLLGYDPRPWTVADSILAGLQMNRTLSPGWRDEIAKRTMLAGGDKQKVELLFPVRTGGEVALGSNAWAVSGKHTASGKPLLAGDPHLEHNVPSTWYMAHLEAPGLNVRGVSIPGIPGILIGHNGRIAWSITNLHFDVQDLYLEKFDPRSGRYEFRGKTEQAQPEREVVRVKGGRPVELLVWVGRHGPVFLNEGSQYYSLRWVAAEDGFEFPILDVNRARNWEEFRRALGRFPGPGSNFVYADVDGNIGYQAAGRFPIRKSYRGDVPADGASGANEWEGYIPFDELPRAFNPPSGRIVSANQNPFPENYPYAVNGNFAAHFRAAQIDALLASRSGWKAEDMLAVQKDVYSSFSHHLAQSAVKAYQSRGRKNPALAAPARLLEEWNGQMETGQGAPFLATLLFQHLRRAVAERASPGKGGVYERETGTGALDRLLRERPAGWFDDWDAILLRSFVDAADEAGRMQGRNAAKWDYGRYQRLTLAHPVLSRLPWIGRYFQIAAKPMSGSSTTVKQVRRRVGPSMRMAVDLAEWDRSLNNITIGQSGHFLSGNYKDQWEAYYYGRSFPMRFTKVEAKKVLEARPPE